MLASEEGCLAAFAITEPQARLGRQLDAHQPPAATGTSGC